MTTTTRTAALGVFAAALFVGALAVEGTAIAQTTVPNHWHRVVPTDYDWQICYPWSLYCPPHTTHHGIAFDHTGHHDRTYATISHTHPYATVAHSHESVPEHTHDEPDPETPTCTYKHRIIGVPGTTGAGFTSQILIGSEDATATVKLSAYQDDNGQAIDVLDSEGAVVGASTSLDPANSIKRFRLEAVRGWHTVIVEHPTKAAMDAATVALRLREPDSGVSGEHVPGIEHCTTTSTTAAPPPATGTPDPDLVIRKAQAVLLAKQFHWRASVVNIGDAAASPATVRIYHRDREIDMEAIVGKIAVGAERGMAAFVYSSRLWPAVGDTVRICVDPVPGEVDWNNNCASATVERN